MRWTLIVACLVLYLALIKGFRLNVTNTDHQILTTSQKTVWEISQFFHRWNIGLSQYKLKNTVDGAQVRNLVGKFSKFTAAAAGFFGTLGALFSIFMAFTQAGTESQELTLLKRTYEVMNQRLDKISTSVNELKNLIPLENQKQLYLSHEHAINFAYQEYNRCIISIMNTRCTTKQDCLRKRTHIAETCVSKFDIRQNVYAVANGATQDGVFGHSLLDTLKDSSKCDMFKINEIVCGICTLIYKGMLVVSFKERLTIPDYDNSEDSNYLNSALERLEIKRQNIEKVCHTEIDKFIMDDLQNSKSKGSSDTQVTNEYILTFLRSKYFWMDWFVTSFSSDSTPDMWPKNATLGNLHVKSDHGVHTIAWPVIRIDVSRHQVKLGGLRQIYATPNINLDTVLQKISQNLYLRGEIKSLASITKSAAFLISYYDRNGTMRHKHTLDNDENPNMITSRQMGNYLLVYFKPSREQPECTMECEHGECYYYPYSNLMSCRCARGYIGEHCNESRQNEQLKRSIQQLLSTNIKIPSLSTLKFQLEDSLTLLKMSFEDVSNAFSYIENVIKEGFKEFGELMSNQLEWQHVLTLYKDSIINLQDLVAGNTEINKFGLFSNIYSKTENVSKCLTLKEFIGLLNPLKLQKWIMDINYLVVGRPDFVITRHKPLIFMMMDKMKDRFCYEDYKSKIDLALEQLKRFQLVGYLQWVFVSISLGLDTTEFVKRYKKITDQQSQKLKNMTCSAHVANSTNLHSCQGGFYLHPKLDVKITCNEKLYPKAQKRMWVKSVVPQGLQTDPLIGPPRFYSNYGISRGAWRTSLSQLRNLLALRVQFPERVYPEELRIYEVYNGGAVKTIQAQRPDSQWETIWETADIRVIKTSREFCPEFKPLPFLVDTMKVIIDPRKAADYISIDAMMLIGRPELKDESFHMLAAQGWSNVNSQGQSYIEFSIPIMYIQTVTVYEATNPGAIIGIQARRNSERWVTISLTDRMQNVNRSRWFTPKLQTQTQKMNNIRVNSYRRDDQVVSQIDAISVIGRSKLQDTCTKLNETSCVPCDCANVGSKSLFCDVEGSCQCKDKFSGKRCNNRDCEVGQWTAWPKCPCKLNSTIINRTREILINFKGNGKACLPLIENMTCPRCECSPGEYGLHCENRNCVLSAWSVWNKVCPEDQCKYVGTRERKRTILKEKKGTGSACGSLTDPDVCPYKTCKYDCRGVPAIGVFKCKYWPV